MSSLLVKTNLHLDTLAFIYVADNQRDDSVKIFLNGSQLRVAHMAQLQGTGLLNLRLVSPI